MSSRYIHPPCILLLPPQPAAGSQTKERKSPLGAIFSVSGSVSNWLLAKWWVAAVVRRSVWCKDPTELPGQSSSSPSLPRCWQAEKPSGGAAQNLRWSKIWRRKKLVQALNFFVMNPIETLYFLPPMIQSFLKLICWMQRILEFLHIMAMQLTDFNIFGARKVFVRGAIFVFFDHRIFPMELQQHFPRVERWCTRRGH